MIHQSKNICIIGGMGAMGQCLAGFLGKIPHYRITLFTKDDWQAPQKLADQDLIIISVPIAITAKIIHQASQYLSSKTILSDLTSIKQKPMAAMLKYHTGPVVGMHPVFGPDITHAQNHTIAYCHGRNEKSYQWFIDDLGTLKFTLKKCMQKLTTRQWILFKQSHCVAT